MGRKRQNPYAVANGDLSQLRTNYRRDEHVGSESRDKEFKSGPGFIRNDFRANVAKYMCGFINSGENGSLILGVEDSGVVRGYYADHFDVDRLRKQVDEAMKDLEPSVFPEDYAIHFVTVVDSTGNQQISDCYVIEIRVAGANIRAGDTRLYETKQGVFIRRDGSLQGPLSAQKIQEWTRRQYQSENDKLKKDLENLKRDLNRKQKDYDNKDSQMKRREEDLAGREHSLQSAQSELGSLQDQNKQLKAENDALKNSGTSVHQELGEIKQMLSKQGQQKSKVCVIM